MAFVLDISSGLLKACLACVVSTCRGDLVPGSPLMRFGVGMSGGFQKALARGVVARFDSSRVSSTYFFFVSLRLGFTEAILPFGLY